LTVRVYAADLHVHTCLSPCADEEMSPANIVRTAVEGKLDIIAVADHNSGKNARAVMEAAADLPLTVIGGMEVQSREEVHLLSFFRSMEALVEWDSYIYEHLPDVRNDPEVFGYQPIVDKEGYVIRFEEKLLINSLGLSLEEVVKGIRDREGVCILAHVDREAFSITGQLGYIPPDLPINAVEITGAQGNKVSEGYEVVTASDAHFLRDIGQKRTLFLLETPTLEEIDRGLRREGGRHVTELI
jgi:predicted metal-dependent phosphoesterase TrpH